LQIATEKKRSTEKRSKNQTRGSRQARGINTLRLGGHSNKEAPFLGDGRMKAPPHPDPLLSSSYRVEEELGSSAGSCCASRPRLSAHSQGNCPMCCPPTPPETPITPWFGPPGGEGPSLPPAPESLSRSWSLGSLPIYPGYLSAPISFPHNARSVSAASKAVMKRISAEGQRLFLVFFFSFLSWRTGAGPMQSAREFPQRARAWWVRASKCRREARAAGLAGAGKASLWADGDCGAWFTLLPGTTNAVARSKQRGN